jgi:hypothetical protein
LQRTFRKDKKKGKEEGKKQQPGKEMREIPVDRLLRYLSGWVGGWVGR